MCFNFIDAKSIKPSHHQQTSSPIKLIPFSFPCHLDHSNFFRLNYVFFAAFRKLITKTKTATSVIAATRIKREMKKPGFHKFLLRSSLMILTALTHINATADDVVTRFYIAGLFLVMH